MRARPGRGHHRHHRHRRRGHLGHRGGAERHRCDHRDLPYRAEVEWACPKMRPVGPEAAGWASRTLTSGWRAVLARRARRQDETGEVRWVEQPCCGHPHARPAARLHQDDVPASGQHRIVVQPDGLVEAARERAEREAGLAASVALGPRLGPAQQAAWALWRPRAPPGLAGEPWPAPGASGHWSSRSTATEGAELPAVGARAFRPTWRPWPPWTPPAWQVTPPGPSPFQARVPPPSASPAPSGARPSLRSWPCLPPWRWSPPWRRSWPSSPAWRPWQLSSSPSPTAQRAARLEPDRPAPPDGERGRLAPPRCLRSASSHQCPCRGQGRDTLCLSVQALWRAHGPGSLQPNSY